MATCGNCDAYVTRDFIRVFGIDGTVHGCPSCTTYRELGNGNAVERPKKEDGEEIVHRGKW